MPEPSKRSRAGVCVAVALVSIALYLLSIGPAYVLVHRGLLSPDAYEALFLPLEASLAAAPKAVQEPAGYFLDWYVSMWFWALPPA